MPTCPQCHSPLPPDAPAGLCPACLLKRGLEPNTLPPSEIPNLKSSSSWTPPTPEELAPFFPDLDLLSLLGRGGMGAVYKARQKSLDRIIALKILPPQISRDANAAGFAQRFTHEAQALAKLNHPHIVTIYDFGQRTGEPAAPAQAPEAPPSPPQSLPPSEFIIHNSSHPSLFYFLMEYIDGLSLRQLLDANTLAPSDALAIVPQICDALQYAHDRGIVHRDIKPENILLTKSGQIKIADFGLAKLMRTADTGLRTETTTAHSPLSPQHSVLNTSVAGTPQYMSPEQSSAPDSVDHRADIYALGVVFYQMLTGELPPNPLTAPSTKVHIDVRLDEIVLRALQQNPDARYQNATQFKTEVETVASTQSPRSPTAGTANLKPAPAPVPVPVSSRDPWMWSPFQNTRIREICAHMSPHERMDAMFVSGLFGLGIAATVIGTVVLFFCLSYPLNFIFPPIALAVGIVLIPLWRHMQREYLCNTAWAREQNITADQLTSFHEPISPRGGVSSPSATPSAPPSTLRLSRIALLGAAWAPFFFITFLLMFNATKIEVVPGTPADLGPPVWQIILMIALIAVGFSAPFGTTICGLVSLSQIRRSNGRLYGLPLALFDALLFPLLVLDLVINLAWGLIYEIAGGLIGPVSPPISTSLVMLTSLCVVVTWVVVDLIIIVWAWRAAKQSLHNTPPQNVVLPSPAPPPAPNVELLDHARQDLRIPSVGLRLAAMLNLLFVLLVLLAIVLLSQPHVGGSIGISGIVPLALIVLLFFSLFILNAASKMSRLRGYNSSVAASILAMLAIPGNLVGLPMGIWALVILSRRDVKSAFDTHSRIAKPSAFRPFRLALIFMLTALFLIGIVVWAAARHHTLHRGESVAPLPIATIPAGPFVQTLRSGITVELVGISENPSDHAPWWRPDGSSLPARPYPHLLASVSPDQTHLAREFLIRMSDLPSRGVTTRWQFDPSASSAGGGPLVLDHQSQNNLSAIAALVSKDSLTIRFGVASTRWQTFAEEGPRGGSSMSLKNGTVIFSPTSETDGKTTLSVTHTYRTNDAETENGRDIRLIAIDTSGHEYTGNRTTGGGAGNISQITATYDLPIRQIKSFQLQSRPYEWAEFKNIALSPSSGNRPTSTDANEISQQSADEQFRLAEAQQKAGTITPLQFLYAKYAHDLAVSKIDPQRIHPENVRANYTADRLKIIAAQYKVGLATAEDLETATYERDLAQTEMLSKEPWEKRDLRWKFTTQHLQRVSDRFKKGLASAEELEDATYDARVAGIDGIASSPQAARNLRISAAEDHLKRVADRYHAGTADAAEYHRAQSELKTVHAAVETPTTNR